MFCSIHIAYPTTIIDKFINVMIINRQGWPITTIPASALATATPSDASRMRQVGESGLRSPSRLSFCRAQHDSPSFFFLHQRPCRPSYLYPVLPRCGP